MQLGPEGASATTTVIIQCPEGFFAAPFVSVVQNHGGRLARADGEDLFQCTGAPQTVTIPVRVFGDFALKQGKATATARVNVFDPETFEVFTATTGPVAVRVRK